MISVVGIYKNGAIALLEPIPDVFSAKVIVTVLEEDSLDLEPMTGENWLGVMQDSARIVGDIIEAPPHSDAEWQVYQE
jgi:hypothetical protein